jgi:hypothetical protein
MEYLNQILARLTEDEKLEFAHLIHTDKGDTLEEQLYKELCGESSDPKAELYKTENDDAYHSVRKRLLRKISDHFGAKKIASDKEGFAVALRAIYFAEMMIQRNAPDVARNFLRKAEEWSTENQRFLMLDAVYDVQLTYFAFLRLDPELIRTNMEKNLNNLKIARRLNSEYTNVVVEIEKGKKKGVTVNPKELLQQVFSQKELIEPGLNSADFMYKLVLLVRTFALTTKNYFDFYPYAVKVYEDLKSRKAFFGGAFGIELHFIYVIAQAAYRLWKIDETRYWLDKMESSLPKDHKEAHPLYSRYVLMRSALNTITGRAAEAVEIVSNTLEQHARHLPPVDILSLQINLSVNYFCLQEYKKANSLLVRLNHTDRWLDDNIGLEARFKLRLIELVYQVQLERPDIAETRLRSIKNTFEEYLEKPTFKHGVQFMNIVEFIIKSHEKVRTKEFLEKMESSSSVLEETMDDIQAITFFCWPLAKAKGKDYYEVLLDVVKERERRG